MKKLLIILSILLPFIATSQGLRPTIDTETTTNLQSDSVFISSLNITPSKSLQNYLNIIQASGYYTGGEFTDNANGTATIAAGVGAIRATNTLGSQIQAMEWSENAALTLTDNSTNYIYVDYNSGTPIIVASTTKPTDSRTKVLLGKIYRESTNLHLFKAGMYIPELAKNVLSRFISENGEISRTSGAIISETGTRNIASTNGVIWGGLTRNTTTGYDTDGGGTFEYYYYNGSTWVESSETQIDNTQYNNTATGLATLNNNQYGVHWTYIDADGHMLIVYGQNSYTLAESEAAQPPSTLPNHITEFAFLAAKIIIPKNSTSFTEIQSAYDITFTSSIAGIHNDLASLQGGTADEYYHLTNAEHTIVTNTSGTNTGDQTLTGLNYEPTGTAASLMSTHTTTHPIPTTRDARNQVAGSYQAAGTYNTIIGTDTDINNANNEHIDQIVVTDGVITSMSKQAMSAGDIGAATTAHTHTTYDATINTSGATVMDELTVLNGIVTKADTRTITLANLGFTGATNANYITDNTQISNSRAFITDGNTNWNNSYGYIGAANPRLTGTVGINESSPGSPLHVVKSADGYPSWDSETTLIIQNNPTSASNNVLQLISGHSGSSTINFGHKYSPTNVFLKASITEVDLSINGKVINHWVGNAGSNFYHFDFVNKTTNNTPTPSSGVSMYCLNSELYVKDAAGNNTLLSPHSTDAPEWLYDTNDPMPPQIDKETNEFDSIVRYTNNTRKNNLIQMIINGETLPTDTLLTTFVYIESFDDYLIRVGDTIIAETYASWEDKTIIQNTLEIIEWEEKKEIWNTTHTSNNKYPVKKPKKYIKKLRSHKKK